MLSGIQSIKYSVTQQEMVIGELFKDKGILITPLVSTNSS
jgi:hypothetical protein